MKSANISKEFYTIPPGNKLSLSTPTPLTDSKHNGNKLKNQLLQF